MKRPKRPVKIRCVCMEGAGASQQGMHLVHRALAYKTPRKSERIMVQDTPTLKPHITFQTRDGRRVELARFATSGAFSAPKGAQGDLLSTQHLKDAGVVVVASGDWILDGHTTLHDDPGYRRQVKRLKSDGRIIAIPFDSPLDTLGGKFSRSFGLPGKSRARMTKKEAAAFREFRRQLIEKISK